MRKPYRDTFVSVQAVAAAALLALALPAAAQTLAPPSEPAPDYRAIVKRSLQQKKGRSEQLSGAPDASSRQDRMIPGTGGAFANASSFRKVEISGLRHVLHDTGWAWLTCIRVHPQSGDRTYAIFIAGGQIVDARGGVISDQCERQTYQPLLAFPNSSLY
jgi:hypothetical protein